MIRLNNKWEFTNNWSEDFMKGFLDGESIRLPHNVGSLPLHYATPSDYECICGYRHAIDVPKEIIGQKVFLQFDGAAHIAEVFLNNEPVGKHYGGYTAFRIDISEQLKAGKNIIAVKLDCTENPEIPPFGNVIDYLTYGGLYRDVWLDIRPKTYIEDVFVSTVDGNNIHLDVETVGEPLLIDVEIYDAEGSLIASEKNCTKSSNIYISQAHHWSVDHPYLYKCVVMISSEDGDDYKEVTFGMRTAEFRPDGFYLNGEKVFLRGLNRHQSYPYIGYAAPESLQREDARILKEELSLNAVRTSHYPQSQYFLDECDRLGLLVFTEFPGWQHIGDAEWKEHAIDTLKEMILQYRNHPSIILWGVRINESLDDDEFYTRTNELAHSLDPSRQTSGVRYLQKSHLLEDVYAFNDFSHDGTNIGCLPKKKVLTDVNKPMLISEANGHMFPTKTFDDSTHRQEHALRHARVLDAAMTTGGLSGCFQWCMFDYATHQDFGSGDRICYHGVMDSFRNPKLAAAFYQSQGEDTPVLEVGSSFDIGDYPAGQKGTVYAFTNADEIKLYKNNEYVNSFRPQGWDSLPHGPIEINDTIGELLEKNEGFEPAKAALVRRCLLDVEKHGLSKLPLKEKLRLGYCSLKYKMSMDDATALYAKYIGNWGNIATKWRIDAVKDGDVVKSITCTPGNHLHIEATASKTDLVEGSCYDMALIRIRLVDENGNLASYAQMPIAFAAEGVVDVVGPMVATAEGGMCGTYVRTTGWDGDGRIIIYTESGMEASIEFTVTIKEDD
ncbi:MAG: glycoside hydrolase family 2 protein [Lachnospiraceae bacterium]|nr:glycoside hydrolase family 2 protein [Lachnospiraceae bacterium]